MNKDAKIIGIWGGRGSGKSTCAKALVRGASRVIVVDPVGDWEGEGFTCYKTFAGLYKAIKAGWARGFRVCFQIGVTGDPVEELAKLSNDLFTIQAPYKAGKDSRKITLVVDEMSISVPNRQLTGNQRAFLKLCNLGRHWGVEIIGISQRMAQVHMDFRGNTSEDYFFRLRSATDIDVAMQLIGRTYRPQIMNLQTHQYLLFRQGLVVTGKNNLSKKF